ncbi:MAG TPA: ParB/RepB/Spo0J family partition protein [Candidatus Binataceae bacterium]|nr:ParB/RepB/Spo0J family partition protein [Candidatus Binataceae bacterium]
MMRKPLGRGLGALIESTAFESTSPKSNTVRENSSITMAPVGRISAGQFQPRQHFDAERLSELTRAIQSQGIIEPLIVRIVGNPDDFEGPRYELIAGERRLRAARTAGLETVPTIVRDLDDRSALEMSLVENLAREELNAVEEGRAFARLSREFSLSHDDIANRIGKSRPYVSNAIRLIDLPDAILEMIARGQLSAGQARPLLALPSAEARIAAARKIIESGINSRGAEEIAAQHRKRSSNGAAAHANGSSDPNLNALIDTLQRALKRKVRVIRRRGKSPGRVEIDFYDDSDLTSLAATLVGTSRQIAAHAS